MIYLLDTNAVSDLISQNVRVRTQYQEKRSDGHTVALCSPVLYEIQRGFLWRGNARKQAILHSQLVPLLTWIPLYRFRLAAGCPILGRYGERGIANLGY